MTETEELQARVTTIANVVGKAINGLKGNVEPLKFPEIAAAMGLVLGDTTRKAGWNIVDLQILIEMVARSAHDVFTGEIKLTRAN